MNSTDPDPDRTSRPKRAQISLNWSPDAKREYEKIRADQSGEADSREADSGNGSTLSEIPLPGEVPTRTALNALARRAVRQTLAHAPFKLPLPDSIASDDAEDAPVFAVDVSFVSDAEIHELNSSHRGKNKPTDVLSFSQLEGELMPFEMEELLLGDVIVSIETAARQARELKHSLSHEIAFLLAHGVLHLCGYDHDTSARRRAMWKQQDEIVRLLNLGEPNFG